MPAKLGKYTIKSEVGHGGMGIVYLAEDPRLHRPVALKVMSPSVAGDPELLSRFYREAESAGQLRHPNIVTIYDIDEADGVPFIAMEFLEGDALEKIIATRKELPVVKKLDIIAQTCKGLHYAHQHGIVHRDVKPANIVIENDGLVKIVDFGIARIGETHRTRTGTLLGTPMYMSPEQVLGHTVDARSDLFSVGVILYELLTYRHAFFAPDIGSILYKIINDSPEPVSNLLPNCPPQLEGIVARAMAKNPEERYQRGEDLAFDLQQMAEHLKRHMIEVYTREGQRSIEEGNLTLAKEALQRVLEIDSSHDLAKELLSKVHEQIRLRQRTQKIEQTLSQAKEALRDEQYDEAVALLDEVLALDPEHAEAKTYKALTVEQHERARSVARHLELAEKLMADADLQGAQDQLGAVLALDPEHSAARKMKDTVGKMLAEQERMQQVRKHIAAARLLIADKNFDEALRSLEKANQLDPINLEVESLVSLVRSGQEKEETRRLLDSRIAEIQETLNREEFDAALTLSEEALRKFPEHSQLLKLHTQARRLFEARQKRQYVDEQIQAAREFLLKNQFSSALALLERALETAPDDTRLASFLRNVREAQERSSLEKLRQDAIRAAHDQLRSMDFAAAIQTLEQALTRCGTSPELAEVLQFAREQQAEHERQGRIRHILSRAQNSLQQEDFEEAVQTLERALEEFHAPEIETLLASARGQWSKFETKREEALAHAQELVAAGEASKAMAFLDASPRVYFKNEKFQHIYTQCREALKHTTLIRTTTEQIENDIAGDDLIHAEGVLQQALQTYPGDAALLAVQQRLKAEQLRLRRTMWAKLLDDAKVSMGRMQYREAIQLLTSLDWDYAQVPDLAEEARRLLQDCRQRESTAAQQQQTLVMTVSALQAPGSPKPQTGPTPAGSGVPSHVVPSARPRPRPEPGGPQAPKVVPATVRPPVLPEPVRRGKRAPAMLWVGAGVLVLAFIAFAAWRLFVGGQPLGHAQLTAVPWADVVSVRDKEGRDLNVKGTTPLDLTLPPGEYVVELKHDHLVGKVSLKVKSGEVSRLNYTFPEVNVNALVDDLVSKY